MVNTLDQPGTSGARQADASDILINQVQNIQSVAEASGKPTSTLPDAVRSSDAFGRFENDRDNYSGCDPSIPDSDTRGQVLSHFLQNVSALTKSNDLTHSQIKDLEKDPRFNEAELKMLDFADKHFDDIVKLTNGTNDKSNAISSSDEEVFKNYPHAKMDDTFKQKFVEGSTVFGGTVGAAAEVAAWVSFPAGMMALSKAGTHIGFMEECLRTGNAYTSAVHTSVGTMLWGPLAGGYAGDKIGNTLAEPVWNMLKKPAVNKIYAELHDSDVPTYREYRQTVTGPNSSLGG